MTKTVSASLILWVFWRLSAALMLNVWHIDLDPKLYFICAFLLTFGCLLHVGLGWSSMLANRSRTLILSAVVMVGISFAPIQSHGAWWSEISLLLRIVSALFIGLWVGQRIERASYFWPLVMVGFTMDVTSILLSGSFTQSVVESVTQMPTLVHPLLIYTPTGALHMPVFGLADLVFCMIFVGAVDHLGLPKVALLKGLWIGAGLGLTVLLWTQSPVPLLPFLGVCGVGALGRSVAPTCKDLLQTAAFLGVSVTICVLFWFK